MRNIIINPFEEDKFCFRSFNSFLTLQYTKKEKREKERERERGRETKFHTPPRSRREKLKPRFSASSKIRRANLIASTYAIVA
jgi:hypothetical protein